VASEACPRQESGLLKRPPTDDNVFWGMAGMGADKKVDGSAMQVEHQEPAISLRGSPRITPIPQPHLYGEKRWQRQGGYFYKPARGLPNGSGRVPLSRLAGKLPVALQSRLFAGRSSQGTEQLLGGVSMQWIMRLILSVSLATLVLSGCTTRSPHAARHGYLVHRVMPGETLGCITRWYSGSESQWRKVVTYNPGINPQALQVDNTIKVPLGLATAHTQQPRFSLASYCTAKNRQSLPGSTKTTSPPVLTSTEEVFGPK
jgi:hypothetical protein